MVLGVGGLGVCGFWGGGLGVLGFRSSWFRAWGLGVWGFGVYMEVYRVYKQNIRFCKELINGASFGLLYSDYHRI